ncbi:hypothetical protein AB205_0104330 [Aquarana catesbeiana]|uniref:Uncharacterized protein n=1 Tax=Aquarana catesbeiana TaxID=8400 RepID=A0A2G9RHK1_AQUCT|nr:hypothetical protein AB205_0104330 [Aquarana catesbeiana]
MFQGKEWDTLMAGLSRDYSQKSSSQSEVSTLLFQLGKIVDKKVACFWHADSFDRYIREDINPLGLRIQIFPILDDVDSSFKIKWERNLQSCTKIMMTLLSEEYKKRIAILDKDIDAIYAKLLPFKDLPSFKEHKEKIGIHLHETSQEKLAIKDKKFWRDKRSFQEGKAYKWHQNSSTYRPSKGNLGQKSRDSGSNSSLNSFVSSSSQYRQRNRKPQKNKRSSSGEDPSLNKKRITDPTLTQQSPLLSSIAIFKAKKEHFSNSISKALNRHRELFKLVTQTMNPSCLEPPANETQEFCDELSNFFYQQNRQHSENNSAEKNKQPHATKPKRGKRYKHHTSSEFLANHDHH